MAFKLNIPGHKPRLFDTYQEVLSALYGKSTDHMTLDELNEDGSVRVHLNSEELRNVVLDLDAISPLTVLWGKSKRTL